MGKVNILLIVVKKAFVVFLLRGFLYIWNVSLKIIKNTQAVFWKKTNFSTIYYLLIHVQKEFNLYITKIYIWSMNSKDYCIL